MKRLFKDLHHREHREHREKTEMPTFIRLFCFLSVLSVFSVVSFPSDAGTPAKRLPWTTSRITGSPEPPLPFRAELAFPHLSFNLPLDIVMAPGSQRWFVGEQNGKIYSFPADPKCQQADLAIDLGKDLKTLKDDPQSNGFNALYAIAFHPQFKDNRYCYLCYVLKSKISGKALPNGTRISRFKVTTTNPPRLDPASEKIILTWLEGGHNGCCLKFGPDGFLYISTGDATDPSPPDGLDTGQGVDDLLSCILRIDVDRTDPGKNYAIPPDNPFVKMPKACPEIWSFGFRNPWRMSFDRKTGELWVGDVGWEKLELVFRIKKGGNYGWSAMEGSQAVRPNAKVGPGPILPPAIEFSHTEAASITGGFVYRGKKFPELYGKYVVADWETRKIWGATFDADKVLDTKLIAQTNTQVVGFGEDEQGELVFLDHHAKGAVWHLVRSDEPDHSKDFPRQLSATGLFSDTGKHQAAAGVVPFAINAEQWIDHASAERFIALPETSTATIWQNAKPIPKSMFSSKYFFPKDAVLVKTLSLEMERGNPASKKRLETQILHFDGNYWNPYTYQWNDEQTDATLVDAKGATRRVKVKDVKAPGGTREQTWHYPGRGQCLQCHNPWAGYNLAFTPAQLDLDRQLNQLGMLEELELFAHGEKKAQGKNWKKYWPALVNPHDASLPLEQRARSYLQVNCAHCHQFGGGGVAQIDLRQDIALAQMKAVGQAPIQGDFGISGAFLIAPGDPYRSVLYYRMATIGKGRMPHIGSAIVDTRGLQLVHDWIKQLPPQADEQALIAKLIELEKGKKGEPQKSELIKTLLGKTGSALTLVKAFDEETLPAPLKAKVLQHAMKDTPAHIRDLFERFIPDAQKIKRLGDLINPDDILKLTGSAEQGKQMVFADHQMQCLSCHKVGAKGVDLGPDLSKIAAKLKREKLLENLLQPSKEIEPKYLSQTVVTTDGQFHTGLLVEKNAKEVVLRDAKNQIIHVPVSQVDQLIPQKASLMPDGLLRDLTAQQAADLLAFLESLK